MPKLPDEDFEEAVHIAEAEVDQHQPGRHWLIKGWGGHMPAGLKHSIKAKTPVVMLLVLIK